jgi:uncharacterized protein YndB with AHSA1/START domain
VAGTRGPPLHAPTQGGAPPTTLAASVTAKNARTCDESPPKQQRFAEMATFAATQDLLASRKEVWGFIAEPYHLADWWPGISGVQPDRRGLAPGARWQIRGLGRPTYVVGRRPDVSGTLVFLDVRPPELVAWQFVNTRVDVELRLTETGPDRTRAQLTVDAPFLSGVRRPQLHRALSRLHALCQTGAQG